MRMRPGLHSANVTATSGAGATESGGVAGGVPDVESSSTTRYGSKLAPTTVDAACVIDAAGIAVGMNLAYGTGRSRSNSVAVAPDDAATSLSVRRNPGSESGAACACRIT